MHVSVLLSVYLLVCLLIGGCRKHAFLQCSSSAGNVTFTLEESKVPFLSYHGCSTHDLLTEFYTPEHYFKVLLHDVPALRSNLIF